MLKNVYTVLDSKSGIFGHPFVAINHNIALRDFCAAAHDGQSTISKFPADFTLFSIGTFDDETGTVETFSAPVNLGIALQFHTHNDMGLIKTYFEKEAENVQCTTSSQS